MKYYLATTGISEIWDLDKKLLLLGPWCLADGKNKRLLENKNYTFVSSPWKPAIKIKEAADYCYDIYERLFPQICENLNLIHQVSYPDRYWKILLEPWLFNFIVVFYDRYRRIEKALELFPDFYTNVLPIEQCRLLSFDTADFAYGKINEDYYNLKLFSLLSYDLCPNNIIVKEYGHDSNINIPSMKYSWKRKLYDKLIELLDLFFKSPIVLCDMYHLTPYDMILLKIKTRFKTIGFTHLESIKKSLPRDRYSNEIRDTIKLKGASDKFQSLLYKIVPEAIPVCYIENYKLYRDNIRNIKNRDPVKIVGSAVGWFINEEFKFFAAEAVSKGAKLIDFQHGGGYGTALVDLLERLSLEKGSFYTWGWDLKSKNNIKPFPSPHLSKLRDTYLPRLDLILVVGVTVPRYSYILQNMLFPDDMYNYFEHKRMFLQALSEDIRDKILYKPYAEKYGWNELDIVKKACPSARFILKGNLTRWMQKVKLVVIDHPHTSFIEALTINVPCVFYWDHEVYLMRPEAEGYFGLLRDAGILFKDPLSAAKKVKKISHNPMGWWSKNDVQKARLEFCKKYAYARKDWADVWAEEFK